MRGGSEASNHVMKAMNNCNYTLHGGGKWCTDSIHKYVKSELAKIDEECLKKKEKMNKLKTKTTSKSKGAKRMQKGAGNTCVENTTSNLISDMLTHDIVNNLGKNEYNGNFNMIDGVHRYDDNTLNNTHVNISTKGYTSSAFPPIMGGGGGCGCGEALNR